METLYTVLESEGQVEVCVHVTSSKDVFDGIIRVEVYDFSSSIYIPSNAQLAGMFYSLVIVYSVLIGQLYNFFQLLILLIHSLVNMM